ncbi:hypothetical protein ACQ7CU_09670 [Chryseobacterium arthrosphaerae]|uniref:hypothetical protein n=1 Tax=Chryseobacterium arthrosphaerae TaxID=651561 RepID=UPI003D339AA6
MIKKTCFALVIVTSFGQCKKESVSNNIQTKDTVKQFHTEIKAIETQDESPAETVKTFLKWYRDHEQELDQFVTVKGGTIAETDEAANYEVDFDEVEKELKFLRNTGLFSSHFLSAYQQRYRDGDQYFRQNPASDGPPVNFDYNYFFLTQEDYQADLKNADGIKLTLKPANAQLCYVECHLEHCGMKLRYTLIKKDHWMINSIENIS